MVKLLVGAVVEVACKPSLTNLMLGETRVWVNLSIVFLILSFVDSLPDSRVEEDDADTVEPTETRRRLLGKFEKLELSSLLFVVVVVVVVFFFF